PNVECFSESHQARARVPSNEQPRLSFAFLELLHCRFGIGDESSVYSFPPKFALALRYLPTSYARTLWNQAQRFLRMKSIRAASSTRSYVPSFTCGSWSIPPLRVRS